MDRYEKDSQRALKLRLQGEITRRIECEDELRATVETQRHLLALLESGVNRKKPAKF